jgi:two-component sensor histidine kinase
LREIAASLAVALQQARLLQRAQQDAETKSLLLREINHRVKNNLDAIIGLLYVERRYASSEARAAFQPVVDDLTQRIMGLARVHSMLSAAEWQPLALSELVEQLIYTVVQNSPHDAPVIVDVESSSVCVSPAQAHHLALVIGELTTNTLKYAVDGRKAVRVTVRIRSRPYALNHSHGPGCPSDADRSPNYDRVILTYRDDGPGYPEDILRLEGHSAGLDIVKKIVCKNLLGELALRNEGGAVTEIRFERR